MKQFFAPAAAILLAVSLFAAPTSAHKGHQDNMTDAEMAQMEHMESQEASEMHDAMPEMIPSEATDTAADPARAAASRPVAEGTQSPAAQSDAQIPPNQNADLPVIAPIAMSAQDALAAKAEENRVTSVGDLLGRLHPVAVHFPIALLMFAALAELMLFFRPTLGLETTVRFLVTGGAISAILAVILGWSAGGWRLADRSETLGLHRWNGTAIALVGVFAWLLAARGKSRTGLRIALALLVAALLVQGYLGGEMMAGPNHLGVF